MKFLKDPSEKIRRKTLRLAILSGVVFFSGAIIWRIVKNEPPPEYYLYLLTSISALLIFISSIFVIKYKEMPRSGGLPGIKGWPAVFGGVIVLLISGFSFFFALYAVATGIKFYP